MNYSKEIDLSRFKGGVTMDVTFDIPGKADPFIIMITGIDGNIVYYKRYFDGKKVSINLPVIPDNGHVLFLSGYPVKNILMGPLRIIKVPYRFNDNIKQTRAYPFEKITEQLVPFIPETKIIDGKPVQVPSNSPARFMPALGIAQYSEAVFKNLPQPVRQFVMQHEKGHYYYGRPHPPKEILMQMDPQTRQQYIDQLQEDEEAADDYAIHRVINQGYNFSGALYSLTEHLPDSYISKARILKAYNKLAALNKKLPRA